jgi:signal transduction histidine kinase
MSEAGDRDRPTAPLWMRRPGALQLAAYTTAGLVFTGQIIAVLVRGSDLPTVLAVLVAGVGVAVSWRLPWVGLAVTSGASFAVTAVGQDPLSVWMMAVLVLFSVTFRGKQPVVGTALVASFFLAAYMTVGGFSGGAVVGCAALFSAIAGGATGAALRIYRDHWLVLEERTRRAIATREIEATRRVIEERLRIARDLHDVVGHQVAMLSVYLGVAEIGLPDDADTSRQALDSARTSARNVVSETQQILAVLRRGTAGPEEDALRPTPSLGGLEGLIASFESIGLEVHYSTSLTAESVDPSTGVTIYRIVQEALTNSYRHGEGAATVTLRDGDDDGVQVTVENAIGHQAHAVASGGGFGLVGMRERVESCGGTLQIDSTDDRFRVSADVGRRAAVRA